VNKPLERSQPNPTDGQTQTRAVFANHTRTYYLFKSTVTYAALFYTKEEMLKDIFVTILPLLVTRSLAPRNSRKRRELDSMQC